MFFKFILIAAVVILFITRLVWRFRVKRAAKAYDARFDIEAMEFRKAQLAKLSSHYPHLHLVSWSRHIGELVLPLILIVMFFAVFSFALPVTLGLLLLLCLIDIIILMNLWASSQELALLKSDLTVQKNTKLRGTLTYLVVKDSFPKSLWLGL